jgi:hypothetical protein
MRSKLVSKLEPVIILAWPEHPSLLARMFCKIQSSLKEL